MIINTKYHIRVYVDHTDQKCGTKKTDEDVKNTFPPNFAGDPSCCIFIKGYFFRLRRDATRRYYSAMYAINNLVSNTKLSFGVG